MQIRGLSAFPITPADPSGRIDAGGLSTLLDRLVEAEVPSIGLLGSTGTAVYLERAERRRAVEIARARIGTRSLLLVGIGALRTDEVVRLGQDAKAAGGDAVLLAPVSYTPLTDEEVYAHFATVADSVGLPLCVYNNPTTTHFSFSRDLLARLSRVANIVAVKNPGLPAEETWREVATLRATTAPGFSIGMSGDWFAAGALLGGADAWYSVLGGLCPGPCMALATAAARRDQTEADRIDRRLEPLWALFKRFGSLRVVYAAAAALELGRWEPPRPLLPLPEKAAAEVAATVKEIDLT